MSTFVGVYYEDENNEINMHFITVNDSLPFWYSQTTEVLQNWNLKGGEEEGRECIPYTVHFTSMEKSVLD